jgi:hypothetical protein
VVVVRGVDVNVLGAEVRVELALDLRLLIDTVRVGEVVGVVRRRAVPATERACETETEMGVGA